MTTHPVERRLTRLTTIVAGGYGLIALMWTVRGHGYPFGANDPEEIYASLSDVPVDVGAAMLASFLLWSAIASMAVGRLRGRWRQVIAASVWVVGALLAVGVPTVTVLALTAYLPMLIIGAPFGWPPNVDYASVFDWSLANQTACLAIGVLLVAAATVWLRQGRGACPVCGRPDHHSDRLARLGRWAVGVAVAVPVVYAVTRIAWLLDVPLAITRSHLDDLRAQGGLLVAAGLAAFACVGAALTIGLVRPWGERFPRWLPWIGGRRVPVRLAVIPATYVSLITFAGTISPALHPSLWRRGPEVLPVLIMPLWGLALGVATYAYARRRRGWCRSCGVGPDDRNGGKGRTPRENAELRSVDAW